MQRLRLVAAFLALALIFPGLLTAAPLGAASRCAMQRPSAHSCCDEPPLLKQQSSCCEMRPAAPARLPRAPETTRVETAVAAVADAAPVAPAPVPTSPRVAAAAPAQPPDLLAQLCILRI